VEIYQVVGDIPCPAMNSQREHYVNTGKG
jgi:hypothetical protein